MRWRGRTLPAPLRVARHALMSFVPSVPCAVLFVLVTTASTASADVHGLVPVIASASIVTPENSEPPACRTLECVRRRVDASTTVRLEGEFGRFTGRVTRWDADSLAAFEVDPDWGGSAPVAPIGWSQLSRVDQRVNNSGRAALVGAVTLGALTALFAATVASTANVAAFGLNRDANKQISQAALTGGLIGGALGAGIGAGIGAGSHRWILIYRRR